MLPLPQMPNWCDDELVGSYLTRIAIDNALDSKHVLLRMVCKTGASLA